MSDPIQVTAPSRLHFGMLSFGQPGVRQFGGLGAMIDTPGVQLAISAGDRLQSSGPAANRVLEFARRVAECWQTAELPCRIQVVAAPRQHVGLGSGTQLALATAAALHRFFGRPIGDPAALAASVGRGRRSAIGLYGFARGGLLLEAGKLAAGELSPLVSRVELPAAWRFVLICPADETGLSGSEEQQAFEQLPPVPLETTAQLCQDALLHLVPAASEGRFELFAESLYRFGYQAGKCFAARQGGPFASPGSQRLVDLLRRKGVRGVGQSSWGPTLFALLPDAAAAEALIAWLRTRPESQRLDFQVAAPNNTGASIQPAR